MLVTFLLNFIFYGFVLELSLELFLITSVLKGRFPLLLYCCERHSHHERLLINVTWRQGQD